MRVSTAIMEKHGVKTEIIRPIDHDIASGVYLDMREHDLTLKIQSIVN